MHALKNKEYIETYFVEHNHASVNDCVRDGLADGFFLNRALVSNVRRTMKKIEQPVVEKVLKKEWMPPKVISRSLSIVPAIEEPKTEQPKPDLKKMPPQNKRAILLAEEKRKFVDDLVLSKPGIIGADVQREVVKKFGQGMDVSYVYQAVRTMRELTGAPAPKQARPRNLVVAEEPTIARLQRRVAELVVENQELLKTEHKYKMLTQGMINGSSLIITAYNENGRYEVITTTKSKVKKELLKLSTRYPSESIKVWSGKSPEWDVKY